MVYVSIICWRCPATDSSVLCSVSSVCAQRRFHLSIIATISPGFICYLRGTRACMIRFGMLSRKAYIVPVSHYGLDFKPQHLVTELCHIRKDARYSYLGESPCVMRGSAP